MTTEQNKTTARHFIEASATADEGRLEELLAPDFVAHQPTGPQDRRSFVQHLGEFLVSFSESRFAVEEQIAEGDSVVTRATWRAIHSGDFQGVPATGKELAMRALFVTRIRDGKVMENRSLFDQFSMLQQLGLIPPAG